METGHCVFLEVISIFPPLVLVKKTLKKAKKLFKVSLLSLLKDSLVNFSGRTSRISASSFSSSSVICVKIFKHGPYFLRRKVTIQFLYQLGSRANKARLGLGLGLKSGKAKSTSQSSGFTDIRIFGQN